LPRPKISIANPCLFDVAPVRGPIGKKLPCYAGIRVEHDARSDSATLTKSIELRQWKPPTEPIGLQNSATPWKPAFHFCAVDFPRAVVVQLRSERRVYHATRWRPDNTGTGSAASTSNCAPPRPRGNCILMRSGVFCKAADIPGKI
jgi:hypothetical protein